MDDQSRVLVVNWHRQKGKDFTAAAKAVRQALESGQAWFIVSLTQRQADATFDKCKKVAKALMEMLKVSGPVEEETHATEQWDKELKQGFQFLARTIRLPGGGSVTSLPGRDPDTLAGLTGNVIFTEFGLFPGGGYDHWRVVFPLSTRGFQVIVISTPRGKNTKFYELCQNLDGAYSVHFCDIHHSLAHDGFVLRDNGGESGPGARPCNVAWIRSIVSQCKAAGVPVFVKQLGTNAQHEHGEPIAWPDRTRFRDPKGGDPSEWPADLRMREFPQTNKETR